MIDIELLTPSNRHVCQTCGGPSGGQNRDIHLMFDYQASLHFAALGKNTSGNFWQVNCLHRKVDSLYHTNTHSSNELFNVLSDGSILREV